MSRILRSVGWVFGGGAGLLVAAVVVIMHDPTLWLLSLVLVAGGALLWAAFATAVLTLLVELIEASRKIPAARE
ncbi:MAG: hypothetical protein ACE5EW_01205 [Thermoplasmata archaeon]